MAEADTLTYEAACERLESIIARLDSGEAGLREALAPWRGPARADAGEDEWTGSERARLEDLRQRALEKRIEADLETLELCQEGRRLVVFGASELEAVGRGLEELRLDELVARLAEAA